jgi:hypothetical protein
MGAEMIEDLDDMIHSEGYQDYAQPARSLH